MAEEKQSRPAKSGRQARAGEDRTELFERMPIPKAVMTLAVPTIIGQMIVLIYSLADTFFIGRTGNPYMVGAASLILPVFNMSIPLANMFGVGGGTLISRLMGAREDEDAGKISAFCFYASLALGLALSLSVFIFMNPLLTALGASEETRGFARQYAFCVLVLGGIPTILQMMLAGLLRSVGCARQAGFGVSLGGILNIALDPLFMFVIFPRGMEVVGAGCATMLSNCITMVYFLGVLYSLRGKTVLSLSMRLGMPDAGKIRQIFAVGIPAAVATLLFDMDFIMIDRLMSAYGDIPLAAVGIVLKAERLPLNVGIGLCQGMVPIAGYNFASGNRTRMKGSLTFARNAGLVVAAVAVAMYLLLAPQIMGGFINDAETVRIGTGFLRARCLATPFMFLCFSLVHFFQAVGEGRTALFLAVLRWAVFNIPMLFIFNAIFGMYGIVWTQMIADIFTVIGSYIIYFRFIRKLE